MVVIEGGDDVRADPAFGERGADPGGEADGVEAGMDVERDPRPALAGPDQSDALRLADQRETVVREDRLRRALEAILDRVERRREPGEKPTEIRLSAQLSLRLREASVRSLSALRRMKPAASRWL